MTSAQHNPLRVNNTDHLAFCFPSEMDWPRLSARMRDLNYHCAIVGPHGSGKTTLIEEIGVHLRKQGFRTRPIFVNRETQKVRLTQWRAGLTDLQRKDIVLFDGADLLNMWTWWQFLRIVRRSDAGLIITSHHEGLLPTLLKTQTSSELLASLLLELMPECSLQSLGALPNQLFDKHSGNLRDAMRELYDHIADGRCALPTLSKPDPMLDPPRAPVIVSPPAHPTPVNSSSG